ncbi:hypothetical protein CS063_02305 [Sporanaerobium hydrogeniformans]|uniref:Uncharacterized protein n=1 Tax=Sporanaerobium hydrogeniformans TaxID=3072179 RepID=A0AC61DGC8_9FIRM|nr:hypothetical protein [Sporanaerobium hydrogeniformans]PHV72329.1 hypothetical protein CS063_02305 [Sporanaerobium hydrogeniformans]
MSLMDLKCQESIYITEECCYNDNDAERLLLGKDYHRRYLVYLFFDLPPYAYIRSLKEARIILFKLPQVKQNDINLKKQCVRYSVGALLNFFSIYSCNCSPTFIDSNQIVTFQDEYCCSYTEIDITHIVKTWIEEKIENKGVLLYGNENAPLIIYASNRYKIQGMQPRLRLIYEDQCVCKPLSSVPCTIIVK